MKNTEWTCEELDFIKKNYNILSYKEIAQKLDITPQALTKILNKQNFSFDDMKKLLQAADYNMDIAFVPATTPEKE